MDGGKMVKVPLCRKREVEGKKRRAAHEAAGPPAVWEGRCMKCNRFTAFPSQTHMPTWTLPFVHLPGSLACSETLYIRVLNMSPAAEPC